MSSQIKELNSRLILTLLLKTDEYIFSMQISVFTWSERNVLWVEHTYVYRPDSTDHVRAPVPHPNSPEADSQSQSTQ